MNSRAYEHLLINAILSVVTVATTIATTVFVSSYLLHVSSLALIILRFRSDISNNYSYCTKLVPGFSH